MSAVPAYDYVIVGAGSAGCILAARLSEDADRRVLLLEAGGWDEDPLIHLPLGFGRIAGMKHDWGYSSEPEPMANGRRIECARGKVVGGSSSVNAMAHVRGHRGDYDRWAASGLTEWSYAHALPYFKRQESWEGGETAYRGGGGPIHVRKCTYRDPVSGAYLEAAQALGFPFNDDYNGARQDGFAVQQMTIRRGRRASAASAYLRPARGRRNLTIEVNAPASRVRFEGLRAVGVEYRNAAGDEQLAGATREVLLCGGAINSPQLLMLSGIGDPKHLRSVGIATRIGLAGVGQNLQDHVAVGVAHRRTRPGPFHKRMRYDRLALEYLRAKTLRTGILTDVPSTGVGFVKSRPDAALPDLQILTLGTTYEAAPYFRTPYQDLLISRAVLLRPESRGQVRLASRDASTKPLIFQNILTRDADWATLRAGLQLLADIARQHSMRAFIHARVGQGPSAGAETDEHIRSTAVTFRHTLGTCRMGIDAGAVVDPQLRVLGTQGLRVVDASVMPDMIGGNINAAVMMIAERAADLIRGRPTLPPADV